MPPNRGGRALSAANAHGVLSRGLSATDRQLDEILGEVSATTLDLATTLGLEADSILKADTHKRLAAQVQKASVTDATLSIKRQATFNALKSMAAEMDRRMARGPGGGGANEPPAEEMDMNYFLKEMKSKVSSAMQGADQKAVESEAYKEVVKHIIPKDGYESDDIVIPAANKVSLKCPCTSTTFVDPVQNKPCGHTYSKSAILNHIKVGSKNGGSGSVSCPVAGCSHKVLKANLVEDKKMKRLLRIESNTQQTQPEQDAEEIDDEVPMGETCI